MTDNQKAIWAVIIVLWAISIFLSIGLG